MHVSYFIWPCQCPCGRCAQTWSVLGRFPMVHMSTCSSNGSCLFTTASTITSFITLSQIVSHAATVAHSLMPEEDSLDPSPSEPACWGIIFSCEDLEAPEGHLFAAPVSSIITSPRSAVSAADAPCMTDELPTQSSQTCIPQFHILSLLLPPSPFAQQLLRPLNLITPHCAYRSNTPHGHPPSSQCHEMRRQQWQASPLVAHSAVQHGTATKPSTAATSDTTPSAASTTPLRTATTTTTTLFPFCTHNPLSTGLWQQQQQQQHTQQQQQHDHQQCQHQQQ